MVFEKNMIEDVAKVGGAGILGILQSLIVHNVQPIINVIIGILTIFYLVKKIREEKKEKDV